MYDEHYYEPEPQAEVDIEIGSKKLFPSFANITVDLAQVMDGITERVAQTVSDNIVKQIQNDVSQKVLEMMSEQIGAQLTKIVTTVIEGQYQPITSYGQPKGEPTSLQAMIETQAKDFMNQFVDINGNPTTDRYDKSPRWMHVSKQVINTALERELKDILKKTRATLENAVREGVAKRAEDIINNRR